MLCVTPTSQAWREDGSPGRVGRVGRVPVCSVGWARTLVSDLRDPSLSGCVGPVALSCDPHTPPVLSVHFPWRCGCRLCTWEGTHLGGDTPGRRRAESSLTTTDSWGSAPRTP